MNTSFEKLPPASLVDDILNRKQQLENLISCTKVAISKAPQGKLKLSTCNHTYQYYRKNPENKKSIEYIPKSNKKLVKELAQKDYDEQLLPVLEQELLYVNEILNFLQKNKVSQVYNHLAEKRQELVEPVTLPDKIYIQKWQAQEYSHKSFSENSPNLFTAKNERVRSKSEVIIADTLFRLGIPYRYEFPLKLQKFTVHPDFYCLNVRTRREFAWEHLGMMDAYEYASSAVEKFNAYENAGFYPGDNLIISMETSGLPLSSKQAEKIARHYLI